MSVRGAARRCGASAMWLSKLERGFVGSPAPGRLRRLGLVLGLPYGRLMELAGYVRPGEMAEDRREIL